MIAARRMKLQLQCWKNASGGDSQKPYPLAIIDRLKDHATKAFNGKQQGRAGRIR
jgi:hypothetical protein